MHATQLFRLATIIVLALMASGCAVTKDSRKLMPTPLGISLGLPHPGKDFYAACDCAGEEIPIFVVSGRNIEIKPRSKDPFGSERSRRINFGVAYVTIGEGLSSQELYEQTVKGDRRKKARVRFKRIELTPAVFDSDPWKVKDDVVRHNDNPWVKALNQQLDRRSERSVCIFVHGYNTEFIDNTMLAAEIHHYLGRPGAMISFEWPSESRLLGYIADKGNANYSTRHFRSMLSNLAKECNVDSITIVAHSAGAPIVVNALREIRLLEYDLPAAQVQQKYKLDRVVLAAPDMDLMEFVNGIYDRFYEVANGVVIYASRKDRALGLSERLYRNQRLGRAVGELDDWEKQIIGSVSKIEVVDASKADTTIRNFVGHSYFHRDPWVSSDISAFVLGRTPRQRGLVRNNGEIFWRFPSDYPEQIKQRLSDFEHPIFESFSDGLELLQGSNAPPSHGPAEIHSR